MYKGVNSYSINQLISDKSKLRKKREHKERKARGKKGGVGLSRLQQGNDRYLKP